MSLNWVTRYGSACTLVASRRSLLASKPLISLGSDHTSFFSSSSSSSSSCSHQFSTSVRRAPRSHSYSKWHRMTKVVCATAGSCLILGYTFHSTVLCRAASDAHMGEGHSKLPKVTLYQYRTCPFCCKARAYLDYRRIKYDVVEVNPLFKREMKFSEYKNVPFLVSADGTQINDSSVLISILETFILNGGAQSLSSVQDMYPEVSSTDTKGKTKIERANKYFIMLGERGDSHGVSLAERREEREWREWVDEKLVRTLSPNIYRTPSEALQSFQYISSVGNFNTLERGMAKYCGAVVMYFLSKRLKRKYGLKEDVRQSLYDYCTEWVEAVGKDRNFMGGETPNLADLAVYGVLSAIEGLATFDDVMKNTEIGPWYRATKELVNSNTSSR